jgi:hypothetical protein
MPIAYEFDISGDAGGSLSGIFTGTDTGMDGTLDETEISAFEVTATGGGFPDGPYTLSFPPDSLLSFSFDIIGELIEGFSILSGDLGSSPAGILINYSSTGDRIFAEPFLRVGIVGTLYSQGISSITVTDASVPEPATLTLFGLGLLGLCWRRRKQF